MSAIWSDKFKAYLYPQKEFVSFSDKSGCRKYNHTKGPQCTEKVLETMVPFTRDILAYKEDSVVTIEEVYDAYTSYCNKHELKPLSKAAFTIAFRRYVFRDEAISNLYGSYYYTRNSSGNMVHKIRIHNLSIKDI